MVAKIVQIIDEETTLTNKRAHTEAVKLLKLKTGISHSQ